MGQTETSHEYRIGYHPAGAAGAVHTRVLSHADALRGYKAMRAQRWSEDYYKRIWIEVRPKPEPWVEIEAHDA